MGVWSLLKSEEPKHAIAICSFKHENHQTLAFKIGDRLELREQCDDWYRGFLVKNPNKLGIFPKSFVRTYDPKKLNYSDPAVSETESILREWTSIWSEKYEECEKKKKTHCLMGYFKNVLNLKNVIVENRASIDEIKELKKSTISKILQGNSILGLDVIAFDTNYNKLDPFETTTIVLFEELKKNSEYKNQTTVNHHHHQGNQATTTATTTTPGSTASALFSSAGIDGSLSDTNLLHFYHKSSAGTSLFPVTGANSAAVASRQSTSASSSGATTITVPRSSMSFCLQVSLFNLVPSPNCAPFSDEHCDLCVNLFLYKESSPENSYYLCENAYFDMSSIYSSSSSSTSHHSTSSLKSMSNNNTGTLKATNGGGGSELNGSFSISNGMGNLALFCDMSEKDFELTKNGYKLFLVVYAIRHTKPSATDRHAAISRCFAGGVYDLGSNLCNIVYVTADVRNIQSSMCLTMADFESSIVQPKTLHELVKEKDANESLKSGGKSTSKDSYLTLTFKTELSELSFKNAAEKYSHVRPKVLCRKMDFPEIIMPDDFRNDFFVTVLSGEFQKARNYEFVVNLVQFRGGITTSTNEVPVDFSSDENNKQQQFFFYKSLVYAKQERPKWNEIVNVSIPHGKKAEEIKKTYLRFLIRNRSLDGKDKTKLVGVAYLQITNEDGSAIKDARCHLPVVKLDSDSEMGSFDGYFYPIKTQINLSKIAGFQSPSSAAANAEKYKDFIDVKVKVVSTQLTQNVTLLNLLSFPTEIKPETDRYESLLTYLDELLSVKDEQSAEIVKFLQAILDKLIDILLDLKTKQQQQQSNGKDETAAYEMHAKQIQPRVFEILVAIFQIIENQSKFASFRTVIDAYLSKNFCITLAHKPLLRIFSDTMTAICDKYAAYNKSTTTANTPQITNGMNGSGGSNSNLFMAPAPIYPSKSNGSYQHRHSEYTTPNGSAPNGSSHEEKENENAINTIKSMEYIFKFAFRSRELLSLYNRGANNPQSDLKSDSFDNDIAAIFSKLKEITELTVKHSNNVFDSSSHSSFEANLTKIQSFILKNLINLMPILINSKRYSMSKISEFYIGFLNSRYVLQTQFLSKLIRSKLFESQEGRRVLIEPMCRSITNLITIDNRNEDKTKIDAKLESVGKVFAELMDVLEKKNIGNISQDMNEICRMLLKFSNIFLYFKQSQENRQLYGSILISIMRLMDASHYETFFDCLGGFAQQKSIDQYLEENRSFIDENIISGIVNLKGMSYEDSVSQLVVIQAIYSCVTLLDENTFPKDWFDLLILRNSVILNAMYHIADRINRYHLEVFNKTNKQIWFDYFDCLVKLATDTCLQLEKFNESKRNNIISRYKDMRIKVAIEIKKMWYNLGDKKHHFIQHMVEPFLKVALIPSGEIHNALIPVFFDMVNCEHLLRSSADFESHSVPRELITNVDILVSLGYGDSKFRDAFERILVEKFNLHINLKANVDFVKKFVELFDLLVEYRDLKEDSSEQLKTFYLNEILNFYGNMRRWDIYVKYVEILRKIHKACKNAVCAANTLKLHAELLYWSNEPLEEYLRHPSYPNESVHKTLKERLFIDMINDYTEGQAWEKAFELSKILRGIYDSEYELEKLYKFLRKQADLCENIIKVERYECKFYLVGFYGRGFPRLLQNKRFIFMSEPLEQIMTFRQRVESWFPNSTRILHSNPLSSVEKNSEAQFIQIISVQPIYEEKAKLKGLALSPQVLKYYLHNEVSRFKYTFRKDTKLNEDDPTLWWLKENILTTSTQLPDVINFYPVISENAVDISPIQNAINTVRERLEKLKATYAKIEYSREVGETDKSLIQGTIDAGVLGGLPKYKKFYAPSFAETNPENTAQVEELKTLIIETINWGESFLDLALEYLPNDDLLSILKQEQLPKLKSLFDMPLQPTMRRQRHQVTNGNSQSQLPIDSTPKSSKQSFSLNESTSSSRSFLKQITQVENYPGRSLMSYIGGGSSSKNAAASSSNQFLVSSSNRDSIASIKSLNSDDENSGFLIGVTTTPSASNHSGSRSKIVLDETVNPKRPLRPGRGGSGVVVGGGGPVVAMPGSPAGPGSAQNSTSSPSTSAHSSRPMSHLSHSGVGTSSLANVVLAQNAADSSAGSQLLNSVSMQQILLNTSLNSASSSSRRHTHDDLAEAIDLLILGGEEMPPPPPKPPKTATLKFNKLSTPNSTNSSSSSSSSKTNNQANSNDAGNIGSQSSEDLINVTNQQHNNTAAKSSNSLNSASLQFRYLGQKTTSDSILNRLPEDPTKMS